MWTSDALVNQSELLLPRDSSSGAHTATASLMAAIPSAESASGHLDPMGNLPSVHTALRPTCSHPAADARRRLSLAHARPLQLELRRHSTGAPWLWVTALWSYEQYCPAAWRSWTLVPSAGKWYREEYCDTAWSIPALAPFLRSVL
jgi:hypothetical protein